RFPENKTPSLSKVPRGSEGSGIFFGGDSWKQRYMDSRLAVRLTARFAKKFSSLIKMLFCSLNDYAMNLEFNRNEDAMKLMVSTLRQRLEKVQQGGGKKAIEKQHARNKLSARERIRNLIDEQTAFTEIGAFAGYGMY